jgi:hypothetical protein
VKSALRDLGPLATVGLIDSPATPGAPRPLGTDLSRAPEAFHAFPLRELR